MKAKNKRRNIDDLEALAELVCRELTDEEESICPSKNGLLRELIADVARLQSVLSCKDRKRLGLTTG